MDFEFPVALLPAEELARLEGEAEGKPRARGRRHACRILHSATMIRLAINGASGRMGRTVGLLAHDSGKFQVVAAIEAPTSPSVGQDYGTLLGRGVSGVAITASLSKRADVLVDFSTPAAALQRLAECVKTKTPAVICTTGLGDAETRKIREASKKIAILQASNTSVGVAALMRAVPELARLLGEAYDIEIVEAHHRGKKDAPSGTAVALAQRLAAATGRAWPDDFTFGRKGGDALRRPLEIGIHAVRGGGFVDVAAHGAILTARVHRVHRVLKVHRVHRTRRQRASRCYHLACTGSWRLLPQPASSRRRAPRRRSTAVRASGWTRR